MTDCMITGSLTSHNRMSRNVSSSTLIMSANSKLLDFWIKEPWAEMSVLRFKMRDKRYKKEEENIPWIMRCYDVLIEVSLRVFDNKGVSFVKNLFEIEILLIKVKQKISRVFFTSKRENNFLTIREYISSKSQENIFQASKSNGTCLKWGVSNYVYRNL